MITRHLLIGITLFSLSLFQQAAFAQAEDAHTAQSRQLLKWVGTLYEYGIRTEDDTVLISAEVQNVLAQPALKDLMYPETYTWETAFVLLEQMELKKAFWYLIQLYPEHPDLVMKTILAYDTLFEMDRALISTYYTYAMIDPKVCNIQDGRPVIIRPDLIESGLQRVREMVSHIFSYRATLAKG